MAGESKRAWDREPLQWRQVDFKAGTVTLAPGTTKNGEGRVFPFAVVKGLRELLEKRLAIRNTLVAEGKLVPYVFCRPTGEPVETFRKSWMAACKKAGFAGRLLHDFRRSAVRNMVRSGIPESIAMELSGHKTRDVFERYSITSEKDLRDAARRLDGLYRERQLTITTAVGGAGHGNRNTRGMA